MPDQDLTKAAQCGEPSYIWRSGQQRRLALILKAAGDRTAGRWLDNGCGIGVYVSHLSPHVGEVAGLEYDFNRALTARRHNQKIVNAPGEHLPFAPQTFMVILSHEVLEHVFNDRQAVCEMVRVLQPGGRIILFCPNRGYPFETHGVYWRGKYHFGNIPLVNYLPRCWRDRLAPHVRVYMPRTIKRIFDGLPVRWLECRVIFGAYDNIIARYPRAGKILRSLLQFLERTPLQIFGLSIFGVLQKET